MNLYRFLIPCLLIAINLGCGDESSAQKEMPLERTTNVSTFVLKPDSLIQYSRLSATVKAWRDVTINALESGEVIGTYKDVGDYVNRGEALAQLNMELLQAALIEAEANLKFQAYNYERSKQLFSEGSISEQAYFATEYEFQKARSTAQTLKHRLSYGRIQAPFSGHIAKRYISQGQHIARDDATYRLVQTDSLRVAAWVSESEIIDFAEGSLVTLALDALPNQTYEGTIAHVGPAADTDQRVFPIEIHLPNPTGHIRPGMIGTLKAMRRIHRHVVVIPREAIIERETGPVAFVVKNNKALLRPLSLGPSEAERVVVQKGLAFGDQIIVKGGRDLIDGDRVAIKYAEPLP
ncbi:MAG: efflux RND transporter periplasmic adaptor subunit [Gemmatimonadetes bacterium]|nr:efflux RND transporter periplasmic adaptor subunit [Gemmatimonadota bacterium]MYF72298.1 efflux RND transporter periplasmic adaptor subunit [Gemmatimonadota bacterium]MYK54108.1 efflux RND transporter periplasmic adaptor subunit [Gemmatimonadota bacterium]